MLTEQDIIAYIDDALSPEMRRKVEIELEADVALRREVLQQRQLDRALRVTLGDVAAHKRVRQSVLAVIEGESEEAIKQMVLEKAVRGWGWFRWIESIRPRQVFVMVATAFLLVAGVTMLIRHSGKPFAGAQAAIELPAVVVTPAGSFNPKLGEIVRVPDSGSGTARFADGTVLHLEPGTEVRFMSLGQSLQPDGKQIQLLGGMLSADVARQPAGKPMLIRTPHALVTVVGTAFDLSVTTNRTALEVNHGLVSMVENNSTRPVQVASGEFAVAAPQSNIRYGRLARHPYVWPFSSTSIWNTSIGSDARFAALPARPFIADGPLVDAVRPRRPFLGGPSDPLRSITVANEVVADVCIADAHLPGGGLVDSFVVLQSGRRFALEMKGVSVRADGGLDVASLDRTDLAGPGFSRAASEVKPYGFSNLGGLLRVGELENGIRHALSARISRDRLAGRDFTRPLTVWPAAGNPAQEGVGSRLHVGSLLAIPPDIDIKALIAPSGPAYELARAMQDYGVYVTGFIDSPFVLLADDMRNPDMDSILTRLVPLLSVVINNGPASPGGGGVPRREPAPSLRDETP